MKKKSISNRASAVKKLEEIIDGTKFLGRILTRDGKTFHLMKGDKVVVVRRGRLIQPK